MLDSTLSNYEKYPNDTTIEQKPYCIYSYKQFADSLLIIMSKYEDVILEMYDNTLIYNGIVVITLMKAYKEGAIGVIEFVKAITLSLELNFYHNNNHLELSITGETTATMFIALIHCKEYFKNDEFSKYNKTVKKIEEIILNRYTLDEHMFNYNCRYNETINVDLKPLENEYIARYIFTLIKTILHFEDDKQNAIADTHRYEYEYNDMHVQETNTGQLMFCI